VRGEAVEAEAEEIEVDLLSLGEDDSAAPFRPSSLTAFDGAVEEEAPSSSSSSSLSSPSLSHAATEIRRKPVGPEIDTPRCLGLRSLRARESGLCTVVVRSSSSSDDESAKLLLVGGVMREVEAEYELRMLRARSRLAVERWPPAGATLPRRGGRDGVPL
jgi:hypothetical protein